jgi:hypothetical protein
MWVRTVCRKTETHSPLDWSEDPSKIVCYVYYVSHSGGDSMKADGGKSCLGVKVQRGFAEYVHPNDEVEVEKVRDEREIPHEQPFLSLFRNLVVWGFAHKDVELNGGCLHCFPPGGVHLFMLVIKLVLL